MKRVTEKQKCNLREKIRCVIEGERGGKREFLN